MLITVTKLTSTCNLQQDTEALLRQLLRVPVGAVKRTQQKQQPLRHNRIPPPSPSRLHRCLAPQRRPESRSIGNGAVAAE